MEGAVEVVFTSEHVAWRVQVSSLFVEEMAVLTVVEVVEEESRCCGRTESGGMELCRPTEEQVLPTLVLELCTCRYCIKCLLMSCFQGSSGSF